MKGLVLWALVWLIVVMGVSLSSAEKSISANSDVDFAHYQSEAAPTTTSRKLKEIVHLEDYSPIDPTPSSKASIRHGPIQHGTPLMPYIPRPSPPPPSPGGIP